MFFPGLKKKIDTHNERWLSHLPESSRDQVEAAVRDGWWATIRFGLKHRGSRGLL